MQGVIGISSSVRVDDVSQLGTCVMETTTAETTPMNRTVPFPPRRQVYTVTFGVMSPFDGTFFLYTFVQAAGKFCDNQLKLRGFNATRTCIFLFPKKAETHVVFLRVGAYKKHVNGTKYQYNICRRDLQVIKPNSITL